MQFTCPFALPVTRIQEITAALAGWFGSATNLIRLMKNNPAITSTTVIGDIQEATYGGYTPLSVSQVPFTYTDPVTGALRFKMVEPEGAWFFNVGDTDDLPQTIYGVYVTDAGTTKLLGVGKFPTPITVTAVLQAILPGEIEFEMATRPVG